MAGPDADYATPPEESEQQLMTGEAVALDLRPTSFVLRAAGAIIDFAVYFSAYVVGLLIFLGIAADAALDQAITSAISVSGLVLFIVVAPIAVETATHGKSLGKLAVGARIVRDDGGAIGFRHAFIRGLVGVLEIYMTVGGAAAITALLNARSQRLGDLLAGTYSQHERVPKFTPPVYGVPLALVEWSKTADVARLPDSLARRIAQFLRQAPQLSPSTRERLSRQLAAEASVYVSPVPAVEAELFVAAVSAVRREREFAALMLERARLERLQPALTGLPHRFPDR